jgi:hypothetical protein
MKTSAKNNIFDGIAKLMMMMIHSFEVLYFVAADEYHVQKIAEAYTYNSHSY